MADRQKFLHDFAKLLTEHQIQNTLIVYVFEGDVCNTTLHIEKNDTAELLDQMSDAIDDMFLRKPQKHYFEQK